MPTYLEQIRAARLWHEHVLDVLARAEQSLRAAQEWWRLLPDDVEELDLWCRELEATCLGLRAILAEVRSAARAHPYPPSPHPIQGGSRAASPLPPNTPEAA
ncbi:MAG: hypothetical protein RMJ05_03890 [Thermomicrobium sp.]|nr:hypothetical protein [Thermomicrobium sp.]MDW8005838.1 hypothetical protein [Thermomicrobium sp.]